MDDHPVQPSVTAPSLRLLSYNMQVGIGTRRYYEYVTRGWRHLLPSIQVQENLTRIAALIADYDIVGLQEIDAGSRRSGYENQIEHLCESAGFEYWHAQVNRDLGHFAQHGLGLLARHDPIAISEHKLPGALPGRGALLALFGEPAAPLAVVVTHLALTRGSRSLQLAAIRELIDPYPYAVVMGDTNCGPERLKRDAALEDGRLRIHGTSLPTFPSWRPRRSIDHILTSPNLRVRKVRALDVRLSDHRPVAMEVELPATVAGSFASEAGTEPAS